CENGYQNNGTSCKDIRENTSDTYSGTTCTKCTTDNLLVDNECISKSSLHCQTSDGVSCTECNSDYHDENGTCAKGYVENCSVYDGEKCQTCNSSDLVVSVNSSSCVAGKVKNGVTMYEIGDYYVGLGADANSYSAYGDVYIGAEYCEGFCPDYFSGAQKVCQDKGLVLPDARTLSELVKSNPELFVHSGNNTYWTSTTASEADSDICTHDCAARSGMVVVGDNGRTEPFWKSDGYHHVYCVEPK
ncbi:hypothetical protein IJ732_07540, partial [bacterium]|nr:hypothetical protein [bacterium]